MTDGARAVYEVDGEVVADVRSDQELVDAITLFPGWVVVGKVKLSQKTRVGIILPNAETKEQQHLMLFRIATVGPEKEINPGQFRKMLAKPGDIVILKPAVAQMLLRQGHEFGIVADVDIIGIVNLKLVAEVEAD